MATILSGVFGPTVPCRVGLEAALETVPAQILHQVLMEMTVLIWETTRRQHRATSRFAQVQRQSNLNYLF